MLNQVRSNLKTLRVAAFAGALLVTALPLVAESRSSEDKVGRIREMAAQASTPAEHATVAKQYRVQAEAFDAKAAELEKKVARMAGQNWYHKWPAMAPQSVQKDKQAAVEARRAARECYALADRYVALSVETQAVD